MSTEPTERKWAESYGIAQDFDLDDAERMLGSYRAELQREHAAELKTERRRRLAAEETARTALADHEHVGSLLGEFEALAKELSSIERSDFGLGMAEAAARIVRLVGEIRGRM